MPVSEKEVLSILGSEVQSITRMTHELDKKIFRTTNQKLAAFGISQAQALFIIYLGYYTKSPVYQRTLEKKFGLTNPTVTASIKSLVNKGIVLRTQDPDDGRYFRLSLTELGKSLYEPCVTAFCEVNSAVNAALTEDEHQQLYAILKKLLN